MFMGFIVHISFFTLFICTFCLALSNITIYTNQQYNNLASYEEIFICGIDNLTIFGKAYIDHNQFKAQLRDINIDVYLAQDLPYYLSFICKLNFTNCTLHSKLSCTCLQKENKFIHLEINIIVNKIFSQNNVFVLMDISSGIDFESNRIKFPVISDGKIKLFPYKQSDSITECRQGLVLEKDNLIVYGKAKFNEIFENGTISFRYTVAKKLLCKMSVQNCTINTRLQCYCAIKEKHILQLVLNVTANWSLRKSELTVLLKSEMNDNAIESKSITLPDISIYTCSHLQITHCPRILEEGKMVNCTCELDLNMKSTSSLQYSLRWEECEHNHSNRTTLSFIARRPSVEYLCLFNSTDTQKRISFSPYIIAKAENVTCNKVLGENGELNISCVTLKIYPEALCVIMLLQVETNVLKTLPVIYNNIKILENPDYYRSQCTATINIQQSGTYNLTMSVIPYQSGFELQDFMRFAVNEIFVFVKAFMNNTVCDNFSKQDINITCMSNTIFPQAVCDFALLYNGNIDSKEYITYKHAKISDESMYYTSICTLFLPHKELETGLYKINISMFPATRYDIVGETPSSEWTFELMIDLQLKVHFEE